MTARILLRRQPRPSVGAMALRQAIPNNLCRVSDTQVIPRQYKLVVNWGSSSEMTITNGTSLASGPVRLLNRPDKVASAINKLRAFNIWKEKAVAIPDYYTDRNDLKLDSNIYLARLSTTGSGGEGIVVLRKGDEVPEAPVYTRYIPKQREYRVHVFCGTPIHVQQKRRRSGVEQDNDQKLIRNFDNGWVFCNVEMGDADHSMLELAVKGVAALGLDFGALDIVKSNLDGEYYVLECNTAPGLDSPTAIEKYKEAIIKEYESGQHGTIT